MATAAILDRRPRPWHSADMAKVKLSIVLDSGARIGPGKARLLESIRDTGSISAAAREMEMSYKRAWLLVESINQAFTHFEQRVIVRRPAIWTAGNRMSLPVSTFVIWPPAPLASALRSSGPLPC
jgi:Bacterial regulatory helix-turn-helix protein, lysR family